VVGEVRGGMFLMAAAAAAAAAGAGAWFTSSFRDCGFLHKLISGSLSQQS